MIGHVVVGGPTVVLDLDGLRVVSDPTFDPPGEQGYLTKREGPALSAEDVGRADLCLVSHVEHPDNLDASGRAYALESRALLTTRSGAAQLGGDAVGLAAWQSWSHPDADIEVVAVPATHGPEDAERDERGFVNCEVAGWVLLRPGARPVYLSGDNASLSHVEEVRARFGPVGLAVLHAGAASVPAKFDGRPLSLTAERTSAAAQVLGAEHVVAAHCEGWAHFTEGWADVRRAFEDAGIAGRLCHAAIGEAHGY